MPVPAVIDGDTIAALIRRVDRIDSTATAAATAAAGVQSQALTQNYTSKGDLPTASDNPGVIARVTEATRSRVFVSIEKMGTGTGYVWVNIYDFEA